MIPNFKFALREDVKNNKEFLPTRATPKATGWDVSVAWEDHKDHLIYPGEFTMIPLGIRCIIPDGFWLELKSRSSTFTKKKMHSLIGTIDCDYTGMLYYCATFSPQMYDGNVKFMSDAALKLNFGDKIGQLIPIRLQEMNIEEVNNDEFEKIVALQLDNQRKDNGFGSTDIKEIK